MELSNAGIVMLRRVFSNSAAAIAACGVMLSSVNAVAGDMTPAPTSGPGWVITVGGMANYGPEWDGAKTKEWSGLPTFSWRREGKPAEFSAPDEGLDYALIDTPTFQFGPVGALSNGRSYKDDSRLTGLHNYSTSVEAGVFMEYWLIQDFLRTRVELRHGLRSEDGFVMDLSADVVKRYGKFTLSAGPRLSFSDSDEMAKKYGFTAQEAAANGGVGASAYNPDGGLESVGATVALRYAMTPDVTLIIYDRFDYLVGDAADSPIVKAYGSDNQNTVGVGLSYSFHTGR